MTHNNIPHEAPVLCNLNVELETSSRYVELSDDDLFTKYAALKSINKSELMSNASKTVEQLLGRLSFELTARKSDMASMSRQYDMQNI